jgi:poly(3-hydroxybutyrate) depolymerase
MSSQSIDNQPPEKARNRVDVHLVWLIAVVFILLCLSAVPAFLPRELPPYTLSYSLWYADFRFWSSWVSRCCWLVFFWCVLSVVISLVVPRHTKRMFFLQPAFFQTILAAIFVFCIGAVWYHHATLPLATVFSPVLSPIVTYYDTHYVLPLADYYTTREGRSPAFWFTAFVVLATVSFVVWRFLYYFYRWKQSKIFVTFLFFTCMLPFILGVHASAPPPRVATSVGIFDVQSKDDLLNFTAEDIRELVRMENERSRRTTTPHPVLVYCFEERSFHYTGGKHDNAEIKYRLRVPNKIVSGRKYPLVVHLHGVGEAGRDNMHSLGHLHSILPLLMGPDQQDFFMLVVQCPLDNRAWTFRTQKDGNLDVVIAATDHVIENNPIDKRRLSIFGLSSGGQGVWQWLLKEPTKFAAAVPASCRAPYDLQGPASLAQTSIWTFRNKNDGGANVESIHEAIRVINGSGGFMKHTEFEQGGHAAWRLAMGEYKCFEWMIAQKRGGWFNPPPEREVYQGRSFMNSFFAFFLPLGLAAGLLVFQRSHYCERLRESIAIMLTPVTPHEEEEGDTTEAFTADEFRSWTDVTGTKQIKAKIVGFQEDTHVRIQSPEGKIAAYPIKQFCVADQEFIRNLQAEQSLPEGFQRWTKFDGSQSLVAKFIGFQSGDKAILQSLAGKTLAVPINQLGQAEQEFLATQQVQSATETLADDFREWSNRSGTRTITAKLLGFQDDKARFELQNGQTIVTPIQQFAAEDQALLTQMKDKVNPPTPRQL